jgi:peptidoglycan/xylan/chitin deacetylase (PgdA/CDA1 family)
VKQVLVLNYHAIDIGDTSGRYNNDPVFAVPLADFQCQLDLLQQLGIPVVSIEDICTGKVTAEKSVAITFDDGYRSDCDIAVPALEQHGMRASFFVPTSRLEDEPARWADFRSIVSRGFEVGSHSVSHRYFTDISASEQYEELRVSKMVIEDKLGVGVPYFALPGGKYSKETIDLAKKSGYEAVLTTNFALNNPDKQPYLIHRWTVKRQTNPEDFEKTVRQEPATIRKKTAVSMLKKQMNRMLGNALTDRLNYFIHS